jgi:two-component system response regulator HydG
MFAKVFRWHAFGAMSRREIFPWAGKISGPLATSARQVVASEESPNALPLICVETCGAKPEGTSNLSPASHGSARILVVDDKFDMADTIADSLRDRGWEATALASSQRALGLLEGDDVDALVTDLRMPDVDGLALLAASRRADPTRPVIIMTAYGEVESAIESIRHGAHHYLVKPFKLDELVLFLERALDEQRVRSEARALRAALAERFSLGNIVGHSAAMQAVYDVIERVKDSSAPVLVGGETGTGKGLVAHALHAESGRRTKAFVAVNCASLPETLLESELFGHAKGAFTGATGSGKGLFAEADGGTLLLDEIGEMAPTLQAKLLHVLENGTIRPVGATKERAVDVRIVAATHRDLRELVHQGRFREDLFYRLDVITLEIPALRHRREDIPLLANHFLARSRAKNTGSAVQGYSPEALGALMDHSWPGNVRELAHVIERLVLLGRSAVIQRADLPAAILSAAPVGVPPSFDGAIIPIRDVQRRYAAWAFEQMSGSKRRAAERLGIDVKTLAKWLSEEVEPSP